MFDVRCGKVILVVESYEDVRQANGATDISGVFDLKSALDAPGSDIAFTPAVKAEQILSDGLRESSPYQDMGASTNR